MSIRVMSLVWTNYQRGGSEKLAMLALADWCNDQGESLHPSIAAVAKKINTSESQARRIIHGFIDDGYLEVVGNLFGGPPGTTRQYRLNIQKLAQTPSAHATPSMDATPSTHARRRVAPMRERASTHATQSTIEPSVEPPIKEKYTPTASGNPRETIFGLGVSLLTKTGLSESSARSFLGKHAKNGHEAKLATLIAELAIKPVADPRAYIAASFRQRAPQKLTAGEYD